MDTANRKVNPFFRIAVSVALLAAVSIWPQLHGDEPAKPKQPVSATDPDEQLSKAKETFQSKVEDANGKFVAAFGAAKVAIEKKGGLNATRKVQIIEQLDADLEEFQTKGTHPISTEMKAALGRYKNALYSATTACKKAFKKASDAYGTRDKEAVKQLDAELEPYLLMVLGKVNNEERLKQDLSIALSGSKWEWPDKNVRQPWFVLNPGGSVSAGWHTLGGSWEVVNSTTIKAVIRGSDRNPDTLVFNVHTATLTSQRESYVSNRIK